jgi:hypothetical protein
MEDKPFTIKTMRPFHQLSPLRKASLIAGILYLFTFVSIPSISLYAGIHDQHFMISLRSDTPVIIGGLLEMIVALSGIATAVVLYPILKKYSQRMSLGLVVSRVLEAATIFAGVAFLLSAVSLHKAGLGSSGIITAQALVTLYDKIFLLGQSFIPAINDLLLGILLYRSGLVPRGLAIIGIAGAVPLVAGFLAILFGCIDKQSILAGFSAVLVAVFEFSLGLYLVIKGFRSTNN